MFLFVAPLFLYFSPFLAVNSSAGSDIKRRYVEPSKYEVLSTFEAAFQVHILWHQRDTFRMNGGEVEHLQHLKDSVLGSFLKGAGSAGRDASHPSIFLTPHVVSGQHVPSKYHIPQLSACT
jgi:hypothetical protein